MRCNHAKWSEFFNAIGDENRQAILHVIKNAGEMKVSDIVKEMKISQPTVSHHLKILQQVGIVQARREGKEIYYSVNHGIVRDCCGGFMRRMIHRKIAKIHKHVVERHKNKKNDK